MDEPSVIVMGLGPIGLGCARAILADHAMRLVGLIDCDPAKVGASLGELDPGGGEADGGPRVVASLAELDAEADLLVLATGSGFDRVAPDLSAALERGLSVVSSCEQMTWPWYRHAALADQIDAEARAAGRALLGTGVNPGFVMDTLAVVLGSMVQRVRRVRCERRVEASLRRAPLQKKIGATMGVEVFNEQRARDAIGHRGLAESVALIAAGFGRDVGPGSVQERLEPVIAERPMDSAMGLIETGAVAGIHNTATWGGGGFSCALDLTMAVGCGDPGDRVILEGPVRLELKAPGGVPGDSATVAALVNQLRNLRRMQPGLRTMLDAPPSAGRG